MLQAFVCSPSLLRAVFFMSTCQLFLFLFTSQFGKWLLRTTEQCRLLVSSVMKVTGHSGFWKVDWTGFLHSLQSMAISRSFAIRFFSHSPQFGLCLCELGLSLFTQLTLLLSSNFKSCSVFSPSQAAFLIISSGSPNFLPSFGAEILSELYLTLSICTQRLFRLQTMLTDSSAIYSFAWRQMHVFCGFRCQLPSLLRHWVSFPLLGAKQCLLTHWCV